jgi:hypothetical protein
MRGKAFGWALNGAAVALLAVYFASALPVAAGIAGFMLRLPARATRESLPAARARLFGAEYTAGVDALRRALPPAQPYILVAGGTLDDGGVFWMRYDLAPRPPLFLGQLDRLAGASGSGDAGSAGLRRALAHELGRFPVVVAYAAQPPRLLDGETLLRWIERRGKTRGGAASPPAAPPGGPGSAAASPQAAGAGATGMPGGPKVTPSTAPAAARGHAR